ncbi:MFS transporter [bacterium]|nr:MAG: MFS transporter [bacterium]
MTTEVQVNQPAAHDIALEKIGFLEKLSFFFATMSSGPILTMTGAFLMIFYTDVIGLNPIAIGTLFLISRLVDAINDPLMGFFIERMPRTKAGKFRVLLMVGGLIATINFALMWFGPAWSPVGKLAIAYVSYLLLGFTYDIFDIAKNSLLPSMTASPKERSSLGSIGAIGGIVGGMAFSIVAPPILAAGNSSFAAYSKLILIVCVTIIFMTSFGGLFIKERVIPAEDKKTKTSVKEYLNIFAQGPVLALLFYNLLFATGYYLYQAVNAYFFTYVMKDLALLGSVSSIMLVGLLPGIFLSGWLTRKLGKKRLMMFAAFLMALGFIVRWIDPTSAILIYASTIFAGFTFGLWMPVSMVLMADVIDYIELKLGHRSEPAVASITSFISKAGNGIGGALPGFVLGLTGYIAGSQQQPASAIAGITNLSVVVPVAFFLGAAVIFGFGWKLDTKKLQEVEDTLSERRAVKLNAQK